MVDYREFFGEILRERVEELCEVYDGADAELKVSLYDIRNDVHVSVNGDDPGWAASIIKVPIMVSVIEEVEKGNVDPREFLPVNHKYTLESHDAISRLDEGEEVGLGRLLYEMIVHSDNEATNMLADRIGVMKVNESMWNLGMDNSMLGHLLCPGVPRYSSEFNEDGSNITTPNDMMKSYRHIYDEKFSKLSPFVRRNANNILDFTKHVFSMFPNPRYTKSKCGVISDPIDGSDIHDTGIVDDNFIYTIMANKVGQGRLKKPPKETPFMEEMFSFPFFSSLHYNYVPEEDCKLNSMGFKMDVMNIYEQYMDMIDTYKTPVS